jgi:hypothetical protein
MAKFGIKQTDFSNGLVVTGSLLSSGSFTLTGSANVTGGITGSLLGTASYASNSNLLDGYHSSAFPRLNIINTFTADQQILISGSKEIGTFEGDTFFILDNNTNAEIGLSNALSDFNGPYSAGIYISSGSHLAYLTAIEIPNGINFPAPSGSINLKFPTNITGSLRVTEGASGSFSGSFQGDGSGITNISASSIVGLNLAQIASGSITASVSPDYGFRVNANASISGSLIVTEGITGSLLGTASFALTASSADNFLVRGTLTAQTIVAQTITSSTEFITGSTRFGSQLTDTHQFTGSVSITGSLNVNGVDYISTSASFDQRILNNSGSIASLSGSYLASSASFDTRILNNSSSVALLSGSYLASSASFDTRI